MFAGNEQQPAGIAVDAAFVYWTTQGSPGTLRRRRKSGGAVLTLAKNLNLPVGVAVDAAYVYCAERNANRIFRDPACKLSSNRAAWEKWKKSAEAPNARNAVAFDEAADVLVAINLFKDEPGAAKKLLDALVTR